MWPDPADTEKNIAYTRDDRGGDEAVVDGPGLPQLHRRRGLRPRRGRVRPREVHAPAAELKAKWDPTNLFRHNQNIAPAPPAQYACEQQSLSDR